MSPTTAPIRAIYKTKPISFMVTKTINATIRAAINSSACIGTCLSKYGFRRQGTLKFSAKPALYIRYGNQAVLKRVSVLASGSPNTNERTPLLFVRGRWLIQLPLSGQTDAQTWTKVRSGSTPTFENCS